MTRKKKFIVISWIKNFWDWGVDIFKLSVRLTLGTALGISIYFVFWFHNDQINQEVHQKLSHIQTLWESEKIELQISLWDGKEGYTVTATKCNGETQIGSFGKTYAGILGLYSVEDEGVYVTVSPCETNPMQETVAKIFFVQELPESLNELWVLDFLDTLERQKEADIHEYKDILVNTLLGEEIVVGLPEYKEEKPFPVIPNYGEIPTY